MSRDVHVDRAAFGKYESAEMRSLVNEVGAGEVRARTLVCGCEAVTPALLQDPTNDVYKKALEMSSKVTKLLPPAPAPGNSPLPSCSLEGKCRFATEVKSVPTGQHLDLYNRGPCLS